MQEFVLVQAEFDKIHLSPFLQPVWVPLNGSPAFDSAQLMLQFGVFCKADQKALCYLLQVIGKAVKQVVFQDRPLYYPSCRRCPGRVHLVNYYALSPTIQPVSLLYVSIHLVSTWIQEYCGRWC